MNALRCVLLIQLSFLTVAFGQDIFMGSFGKRNDYDRMLASYSQTQTNPDGGLWFNFEHLMNGKYFTYFTLHSKEQTFAPYSVSMNGDNNRAFAHVNFTTATEHSLTFTVYGLDYSPGPVYP